MTMARDTGQVSILAIFGLRDSVSPLETLQASLNLGRVPSREGLFVETTQATMLGIREAIGTLNDMNEN